MLKSLFDKLKLTRTAKATLIHEWFEAEETSKRIDGVKTKGFTLNTRKFNILESSELPF
jgi:uncharacterized protein (UPF0128 family)